MICRPTGPIPADIMIIGEAPGSEEEARGEPFVGSSGNLLTKLLHEQGISRTSCFITNVCRHRPPGNDINEWVSDRKTSPDSSWHQIRGKWVHPHVAEGYEKLLWEIDQARPKIILAVGGTALWALTGLSGIGKWRGSRLSVPEVACSIIPTWHPAACLRSPELIPTLRADISRLRAVHEGRQVPRAYNFMIGPDFENVKTVLADLLVSAEKAPLHLAGDIETRRGHIACFGIAWSETDAICIPFLRSPTPEQPSPFYWTPEQEAIILFYIWALFRHDNIVWPGQNYLYDCQYFHRHWHVLPKNVYDTMIGHHATFSTMRKGLDFLSSLYAADHVYWKDESKDWSADLGEKQLWIYNCKDACVTFEISPAIQKNAAPVKAHHDFQQSLFFPVLRIMNRGLRVDKAQRQKLKLELLELTEKKQAELNLLLGHEVNPRSSTQLLKLFYTDFALPGIRNMKSEGLTANSAALQEIALREPILTPVCQRIAELRSIGVFLSTFINAQDDIDGRMRCSFGIAGPSTFRFNSSENAFGSGMNLQNLPVEVKKKIKGVDDYVKLPNIRKLFLPDPGYEFFDLDLDRADLQIVVWEANDNDLRKALKLGIDLHCMNACDIFDIKGIPFEELIEPDKDDNDKDIPGTGHPNYRDHKARIGYDKRQKAKAGVHATNYGVGDYKLAQSLGTTVREAGVFRGKWFAAHPGIRKWQLRVALDENRGFTENKFGARLYHLGRFDLPEALAWIPQSTVAGVINRALVAIDREEQAGLTKVQLLLQVHDSLGGQYPILSREQSISDLIRLSQVVIPYPDPLVIPVGVKTSQVSWGDCK